MTTLCPKCHHLRPADTTAPAWQCPACGVAYAKAAEALRSPAAAPSPVMARRAPHRLPWLKLLMLVAIVWGAWTGWQLSQRGGLPAGSPGSVTRPNSDSIRALAATVKAEDVVMYTTSVCPHCASAKGWLAGNGFAFTECNMSVDPSCVAEARRVWQMREPTTPYPVVRRHGRTHPMKNGFDSDEFLAAVRG